jgi:hypothetical protein
LIEGHAVTGTELAPVKRLEPGATVAWLEVPTLPTSIKKPKVPFPYAGALNFERKGPNEKLPLIFEFEPVEFVLRSILHRIREAVLPAFEPFLG